MVDATNSTTAKVEAAKSAKIDGKQTYNGYPGIRSGMTVKVHQKIKEKNPKGEEKERVQVFEGMIIGRKHGQEKGATITVRKISSGIGVEKIFPLYSPNVAKIEVIRTAKVRRAKLGYLKNYKKRFKEEKS